MVRFSYLIPRIIIIALIAIGVFMSQDPLLQRLSISQLEKTTGAKVEIGELKYDLSTSKLMIKEFALADPLSPMRNFFQTDMAYLDVDLRNFADKQIVFRGSMEGLVFGAPRTDSGALATLENNTTEPTTKSLSPSKDQNTSLNSTIASIGQDWLDQFPVSQKIVPRLDAIEFLKKPDEIPLSLKNRLGDQLRQIGSLQAQINAIHAERKLAVDRHPNPLRPKNDDKFEKDFALLVQKSHTISTEFLNLEREALQYRERLRLDFGREMLKLQEFSSAAPFEGKAISRLLLTQLQEERVAEIVAWFKVFRNSIPDPAISFTPVPTRGKNLKLPGAPAKKPGLLIEKMEIDGEGRFANEHMKFYGTVENLSPEPQLHELPTTINLRAQGAQHFIASCTLDRRTPIPQDQLKLQCPQFELSQKLLGENNSLLVTLGGGSQIQADIELETIGEQLTGKLIFRHSNVALHVDKLNNLVGGKDVALQLNQGLASVESFQTTVQLSGTMDDYHCEFTSDLGSKFAMAANEILRKNANRNIQRIENRLKQKLEAQLLSLNEALIPKLQIGNEMLGDMNVLIKSTNEEEKFRQRKASQNLPEIFR